MYLPIRSIADNVTCHPRCQSVLLVSAFFIYIKKYRWYTAIVKFIVVVRATETFENPCCRHDSRGSCSCSRLDRDTGYNDTFRDFPQFSQPDYGILSRLEQGRSFKIFSNP